MGYDLSFWGTAAYTAGAAKFGSAGMSGDPGFADGAMDAFIGGNGTAANGVQIGTGTIEGWVSATGTSLRVITGRQGVWWIGISAAGKLIGACAGKAVLTSTATINDGTFHHVAGVWNAGVLSLYCDGARVAVDDGAGTPSSAATNFWVGSMGSYEFTGPGGGYLDEVRVSKTARYSGTTYTTPTAPFSADSNTAALYHMNGSGVDDTTIPAGGIAPTAAGIVYSPNNWDVTSTRALTNCSGAYFRAMLVGSITSLALTFDVSSLTSTYPTQIKWRIDRGPWTSVPLAATVTLTLPSDTTAWGKHLLEVMVKTSTESVDRWSSPYATAVKFTGITVSPNTVTLATISSSALRGLVFGDSIPEGINVLSSTGDTTVRSDAQMSYAYSLADRLGAEIGVIAFGRQGLTVGGNGNVPTMLNAWKLQAASLTRSFALAPDFVVIHQGTNDFNQGTTSAAFQAALTALLNDMITTLPSATRIFVTLPFGGMYGTTIYQAAIAASSTPSRVAFINTTGWWSNTDSPDGTHPYGYAHLANLAPMMATAIRGILGAGKQWINNGGTPKRIDGVRY